MSKLLPLILLIILCLSGSSCEVADSYVTTTPESYTTPTDNFDEESISIATPEIVETENESQLLFNLVEANCEEDDRVFLDSIPKGRLWFAGTKENQSGLYYLDSNEIEPTLVKIENGRIAKGVVTNDGKWFVYSILCDPGENCPQDYRSDYLAEWVIASTDGTTTNRLPFVGGADPYQWNLLSSSVDGVDLLISPGGYWLYNGLQDFKILQVPTGQVRPFPFHSELPDLSPYGGVYFSIGVAIDPTLTRGFYYACCEPERLMLRDVENDMNLWEVDILTDVVDAVILSPWRWSPDGELIAFTFATDMTKSYDQPRGDVFLLDKDGSRFWQVTDFSEIIAGGYISEAGSWSPDSTKLVVSVQSIQGENRIRSFIIDLISHSTFEICYDYYTSLGIWSPDSDYFIPYDSQVSVIFEIQSGNYGSITAFNEIYPRWFSWLP